MVRYLGDALWWIVQSVVVVIFVGGFFVLVANNSSNPPLFATIGAIVTSISVAILLFRSVAILVDRQTPN